MTLKVNYHYQGNKMYNYEKLSEIPKEQKSVLKERLGDYKDYSMNLINDTLNSYEQELNELEQFKDLTVEYKFPGKKVITLKPESIKQAYVELDRVTNYGEGSDVTAIFKQAGRFVRGYMNRQWVFPRTMYDID